MLNLLKGICQFWEVLFRALFPFFIAGLPTIPLVLTDNVVWILCFIITIPVSVYLLERATGNYAMVTDKFFDKFEKKQEEKLRKIEEMKSNFEKEDVFQ